MEKRERERGSIFLDRIPPVRLEEAATMPDFQALVTEFFLKLQKTIEGSQATARQTAVLLRSIISQQRIPFTSLAAALIDAVRGVGEQPLSANPIELAVGNIVWHVLHIVSEEDLSLTTAAIEGLNVSCVSDDDGDTDRDDNPGLSAAARSTLRLPSLQSLLEDLPDSAAIPHTSSSWGNSDGKSKCKHPFKCPNLSYSDCSGIAMSSICGLSFLGR